jgi:hypothetical protein
MRADGSRTRKGISHSQRPGIELLESRRLLSGTPTLLVTVPGPVPASAIAGAKVNDHIEVNIANDGPGKFSGRTSVTLFASPTGTYSSTDAQLTVVTKSLSIPDGTSKDVELKVAAFPRNLDGNYFLLASVTTPTQTVQGVSGTEIAVTPAHVDLSNAITSVPATGHLGSKISVNLNIKNLGNEIADGTLDTLFELSQSSDGADAVQVATLTSHINLKPNASEKLHLSVPVALGSPSGNQFVVAVLDPNDVFNESPTSNNTAVSAVPVSFR